MWFLVLCDSDDTFTRKQVKVVDSKWWMSSIYFTKNEMKIISFIEKALNVNIYIFIHLKQIFTEFALFENIVLCVGLFSGSFVNHLLKHIFFNIWIVVVDNAKVYHTCNILHIYEIKFTTSCFVIRRWWKSRQNLI